MVRVGVGVVGDKGEYVPPQPVSRTTEQMRMKPDFTGASFTPAK
jgi:hypothetical protein